MFNIISKIKNIFVKTPAPTPAPVAQDKPKPAPARVVPTAPIEHAAPAPKPTNGKYRETVKLSPQTNGQYAQKIKPTAIVMHDTGGNYLGSIEWTSNVYYPGTTKRLYASYHCIVARDGRRTITNPDDNRAYHAGASIFNSRSSLNNWSIGVAFERDSHKEPLQEAAMESALEYIIPRMKKWGITPDMVTDHRTVSPNRKVDLKKEEFEKFHALLKKRYNEK
jgi:N-acetyl-anhydromuramyl-L-alanine amidase AmpD